MLRGLVRAIRLAGVKRGRARHQGELVAQHADFSVPGIESLTAADHAEDPRSTKNAKVRTTTGADPALAELLTTNHQDER